LRDTKPVRRTDQQLRAAAFTAAGTVALKEWCKVPLTYGEQVEVIVVSTQVGRGRLVEALNELDESRKEIGASEVCLRLEKGVTARGGGVQMSCSAAGGAFLRLPKGRVSGLSRGSKPRGMGCRHRVAPPLLMLGGPAFGV